MKICLAFSPGGHYSEMQQIMDAFNDQDIFFVTIKTKSTKNLSNVHYLRDTLGRTKFHMIFNMLFISFQSLKIIFKERPKTIVSTGADVTIPLCYLGKIFGAKVIFIESVCRVNDLSISGKLIYPIANLFLVQWEKLTKKYYKAKFWGSVF